MKPETPSGPQVEPERARLLMRRATNLAVAAAALMIAAKLGAWLVTDSVSLLSSLADSVMDVLASLINLFAVRQALQPADREHRFGHGKAEPLAGLGQAVFITASGIFLIVEAVGRIMEPEPIERAPVGIGVMVFALLVTAALVAYQRRV
ncbi:MAG: cation diffusion facilitator family transporter, partial [Rhodospirillales bacterium]|nr:cation diffusion facilitator family transporter [Rhodospirillales bacterium]